MSTLPLKRGGCLNVHKLFFSYIATSYHLPATSYQLPATSFQLSALSFELSATIPVIGPITPSLDLILKRGGCPNVYHLSYRVEHWSKRPPVKNTSKSLTTKKDAFFQSVLAIQI